MCLFVEKEFIAEEPITAYKLIESECKAYPYIKGDVSLFRLYPITYDEETTSEISSYKHGDMDVIEQGLHLFIHIEHALNIIEGRPNLHVIKCIIPKGTHVYEGFTGGMHFDHGSWQYVPSYAVDRVIYKQGYLDEQ